MPKVLFHEHPVLPQTLWTREKTGLGALSKSSTRDLRSAKQQPCSYHAILCCPLVHCPGIRLLTGLFLATISRSIFLPLTKRLCGREANKID
ncbi:unnamed protein product [Lasius platythorax]|uniref:Uncharacterized protein n=1 Tax=Lasius platythorax TaxID=488582 RepID=A0AAV2NUG9_9HYME